MFEYFKNCSDKNLGKKDNKLYLLVLYKNQKKKFINFDQFT